MVYGIVLGDWTSKTVPVQVVQGNLGAKIQALALHRIASVMVSLIVHLEMMNISVFQSCLHVQITAVVLSTVSYAFMQAI